MPLNREFSLTSLKWNPICFCISYTWNDFLLDACNIRNQAIQCHSCRICYSFLRCDDSCTRQKAKFCCIFSVHRRASLQIDLVPCEVNDIHSSIGNSHLTRLSGGQAWSESDDGLSDQMSKRVICLSCMRYENGICCICEFHIRKIYKHETQYYVWLEALFSHE